MSTETVPTVPATISDKSTDDLRRLRQDAVDSATGTLRMEGMRSTPFFNYLQARYVEGELTTADVLEALNHRYQR